MNTFLEVYQHTFVQVSYLFNYKMDFPQPIGTITPLQFMLFVGTLNMLIDIALAYLGFNANDGDNK